MRHHCFTTAALAAFVAVIFAVVAADVIQETQDKENTPGQEDASLRERLFATYATTTHTVISAKTSTVFLSCLSGTDATICKGRTAKRRRRAMKKDPALEDIVPDEDVSLDTSKQDLEIQPGAKSAAKSEIQDPEEQPDGKNLGKFGFTIWTTTQTTSAITVLYTNTKSTLRLSYYCVAGGMSLPAIPCQG